MNILGFQENVIPAPRQAVDLYSLFHLFQQKVQESIMNCKSSKDLHYINCTVQVQSDTILQGLFNHCLRSRMTSIPPFPGTLTLGLSSTSRSSSSEETSSQLLFSSSVSLLSLLSRNSLLFVGAFTLHSFL